MSIEFNHDNHYVSKRPCPKGHTVRYKNAGKGCVECTQKRSLIKSNKAKEFKKPRLVNGVGINNVKNSFGTKPYSIWSHMLRRCYVDHTRHPSYKDVKVSESFKSFEYFKKWFDAQENSYRKWYQMDKDLLGDGKLYSPDTCVFIPSALNKFISTKECGIYGYKGITLVGDKFKVQVNKFGKTCTVGTFVNLEDAKVGYKVEKEKQAKVLAEIYKGEVDERVINFLLNYEVVYD